MTPRQPRYREALEDDCANCNRQLALAVYDSGLGACCSARCADEADNYLQLPARLGPLEGSDEAELYGWRELPPDPERTK